MGRPVGLSIRRRESGSLLLCCAKTDIALRNKFQLRRLCKRRLVCGSHLEPHMLASRNLLVALVVALVAGLAVTAYALYQEKKQPEGVEISVGKNGLSIKEK